MPRKKIKSHRWEKNWILPTVAADLGIFAEMASNLPEVCSANSWNISVSKIGIPLNAMQTFSLDLQQPHPFPHGPTTPDKKKRECNSTVHAEMTNILFASITEKCSLLEMVDNFFDPIFFLKRKKERLDLVFLNQIKVSSKEDPLDWKDKPVQNCQN